MILDHDTRFVLEQHKCQIAGAREVRKRLIDAVSATYKTYPFYIHNRQAPRYRTT